MRMLFGQTQRNAYPMRNELFFFISLNKQNIQNTHTNQRSVFHYLERVESLTRPLIELSVFVSALALKHLVLSIVISWNFVNLVVQRNRAPLHRLNGIFNNAATIP